MKVHVKCTISYLAKRNVASIFYILYNLRKFIQVIVNNVYVAYIYAVYIIIEFLMFSYFNFLIINIYIYFNIISINDSTHANVIRLLCINIINSIFYFNFFDSLVYFNRFIINFLQTKNLRKLVLKKICKLLRV